jgi:YaiO family outer membrane protein
MRRGLAALVLLSSATLAWAMPVNEAIDRSRTLSAEQKYEEALVLLENALAEHPGDGEIQLAIIRVLSWQGNYDAAEKKIQELDKKYAGNADLLLLRANLAAYRGDHARAAALYREVLAKAPDYEDAKAGLERALNALASDTQIFTAQISKAEEPAGEPAFAWQVDSGFEFSEFSRVDQTDWNQEFLQLTRFLDERKTAIHGKITRYGQFSSTDVEYEAGIDRAVSENLSLYATGTIGLDADFRPEYWLTGGGAFKITGANDNIMPIWLTLDGRHDTYEDTSILTAKLGLRLEPVAGWSIAARVIALDPEDSGRLYGRDFRLDGTLTDTFRFYAGYADVPETVAAVTVDTQTWFGGVTLDLTPATTLRLGYARDDRENSYIRQVVNASVSYRF